MRKIVFPVLTVLLICFVSCSKAAQEEDSTVLLSCSAPEFLSPGDKVALISPSYYTPMENVDTAAMVPSVARVMHVFSPTAVGVGSEFSRT